MEKNREEPDEIKEINLYHLEPVLRSVLGDTLIVESYTTKSFLPPGENYGSTILAVDAIVRRKEKGEKENIHMIAKMSPPTEFQRRIFNSPFTFRKEIFMYERLFPAYRLLEKEYGIEESELFDILPRYYGSRLSLDPETDFDDNAVILLENLSPLGYSTGKRDIGYNFEHSKLAVRAMARFHALGVAIKQNKPDEFSIIKEGAKCSPIKTEDFDNYYVPILKKIDENPATKIYHDRCAKVLCDIECMNNWLAEPEEPWATIIHSDFWVNNIMFHCDQNGHPDNLKFVDFQNYMYSKPLRELIFFLHSSTDNDVRAHYLDDLIDLYYDVFISVLTKMDCDIEPFSRESYNAQFPIDSKIEFIHLCFMLKILTINAKEVNLDSSTMKSAMVEYEGNQMYDERLGNLVLYFCEHDWL